MQRFNFGNQITNGIQIASVGAVTAHSMYDASSTLNNMSPVERRQYGAMGADRAREQIRQQGNKTDAMTRMSDEEQQFYGEANKNKLLENARQTNNGISGYKNLTDDEQIAVGEKRADLLRNFIEEEQADTPQFPEIKKKIVNGVELTGKLVYQYRNPKNKFAGYEPVTYQNKKRG